MGVVLEKVKYYLQRKLSRFDGFLKYGLDAHTSNCAWGPACETGRCKRQGKKLTPLSH